MSRPRVVIVGGGFGGLYAARGLKRADVDVTIVDRRNHHLFQPLLYQVATAALAGPDIAAPIRKILRHQENVRVLLGEATEVDTAAREVVLSDGRVGYDHLVLAVGAVDHYFGNDGWAEHAPGLKSLGDALEIRRRILLAYERAEREPDVARRREHLTFVVVGGGPTGVELAGSLAEIARHTLARNFRAFDPRETRVLLVEGEDRVLPAYPPELSAKAAAQLERLGVTLWTSTRVTGIDAGGVDLGDERIVSRTVLWAAGIRAHPLVGTLGAPCDRAGRVLVEPDLSVPDHPEIRVIGDAAAVRGEDGDVPGVAPAAIQMGRYAAEAIEAAVRGETPEPFRYVDKGMMATIGRRAAVARVGRWKLSGIVAWWMWLLVHIIFLVGFRNRLAVMIEWAFWYLTYQRSARVIVTSAE
ncbi:MAG: NAD(P)/FAD-dependent oxidoreductase [Planctomycetota bacterium JB042]